MPLVSIIVPTFNYAHFIGETLTSIQKQEYLNWECIVVDNGSTDQTESVVEEFVRKDPRFHYAKIPHSTTSASRNRGIELSSGDYIQFVDADDQIQTGKISNQVKLFEANPEAGLIYSHALYYDSGNPSETRFTNDATNMPWMPEYTGRSWGMFSRMYHKNIFVISSPLLRRKLVLDAGSFHAPLNWVEDWEFYLRILAQNTWMVYDPSPLSVSLIRVHPKSLSRNRVMMYEQSLQARKRLLILLHELAHKGLSEANSLIKENNNYEAYLYRLLYREVMPLNKLNALTYLYSYARRKKDWKILVKFTLGLLTRRFPVFSTQ